MERRQGDRAMAVVPPEPPDRTADLLARHRAGDPEALNVLYARYLDRLHAVVRFRLGPRLRAKIESMDVVQEAFLASLRRVERFEHRTEGAFFHWLCGVAENRIRDQADRFAARRRDAARERPLEVRRPSRDSVLGPVREIAGTGTPSREAVREEDLARLERAIDDLPETQREALLMVRYEGLSLPEAGERLDRSADAVRMLVARAIVALGRSLGATSSS
jgi:RNA polymerase sigma-70 factor (ECF subfamily)